MAKKKKAFMCTECGTDYPKWQGECSVCGSWNTIEEITITEAPASSKGRTVGIAPGSAGAISFGEIQTGEEPRIFTGISELDRVLGGGLVKGSAALVSGQPGIGKSTLLLQACVGLCRYGKILYISGEESLSQLKLRGNRLGIAGEGILAASETNLEEILRLAQMHKPSVIIMDSVQTVYTESLDSAPGSVAQVRECAFSLLRYAKSTATAVILVGHVNKDGGVAGPKLLEHMVDTVLSFEGDRHVSYRVLRATKNRFGSTDEIGMFEMTDKGLSQVLNPSEALLSGRPENTPGSCVTCVIEGTRPLLAEIQGLVTKSAYGSARRTSSGMDYNRAVLIMAILEKRAGFMLGAYDAYINVVGGLQMDEPAADLAAALAISSSYLDKVVPGDVAVFGELGLAGELRSVSGVNQRLAEAARIGFTKCILPEACRSAAKSPAGMQLLFASDIRDAIGLCFRK